MYICMHIYIVFYWQYKEAFLKANPDYKWYNPEKVQTSTSKSSSRPTNPLTVQSGGQSLDGITPGKLAGNSFDK